MNDEKDNLQAPPKPEWAIVTALKFGTLSALVGAALAAVVGLIFKKPFKTSAKEISASLGALGAIDGYVYGARRQAVYPLQIENVKLQQENADLKKDKSFAQIVAQEKLDQNPETPTRS